MLNQNVDCHKCGCSNKLGAICCRNCGTKLKFDKSLLNKHKNKRLQKVFKRMIKSCIFLAIVTVLIMAFCPYGFSVSSRLRDKEEINLALVACKEIDTLMAKNYGKLKFVLTTADATFIANYLGTEHDRKRTAGRSSGFNSFQPLEGTGKLGSSSQLGGTGKMGSSKELGGTGKMGSSKELGGTGKMEFEEENAPTRTAYVDPNHVQKIAWEKEKREARKNKGKAVLSRSFDFIVSIKDDKTLSLIVKEQFFGFLPCRLELFVVPKLAAATKDKAQRMEYELVSARFGYLPLPLYLREQIFEVFEVFLLSERKLAKQYLAQIKSLEIKNDMINVVISK